MRKMGIGEAKIWKGHARGSCNVCTPAVGGGDGRPKVWGDATITCRAMIGWREVRGQRASVMGRTASTLVGPPLLPSIEALWAPMARTENRLFWFVVELWVIHRLHVSNWLADFLPVRTFTCNILYTAMQSTPMSTDDKILLHSLI